MGKKIYEFRNIPTCWEDIKLEDWMKIQELYYNTDNIEFKDIIQIFVEDDIKSIPVSIVNALTQRMSFFKDNLKNEPSNEIVIDDIRYRINIEEEMKFGEFVDSQDVLQQSRTNYAAVLAILCRKVGEEYNDDFIENEYEKRVELFKSQPITKIYPLIGFFLLQWTKSENILVRYTERLKEAAINAVNNIETSANDGDGRKRFTKFQMKKLLKLKEYLKSI